MGFFLSTFLMFHKASLLKRFFFQIVEFFNFCDNFLYWIFRNIFFLFFSKSSPCAVRKQFNSQLSTFVTSFVKCINSIVSSSRDTTFYTIFIIFLKIARESKKKKKKRKNKVFAAPAFFFIFVISRLRQLYVTSAREIHSANWLSFIFLKSLKIFSL